MLLHITKIEYVDAVHLNAIRLLPTSRSTGTAIPKELIPRRELPIQGLAALETEETVEHGVRVLSAKLTATLCGTPLPVNERPQAFILTSADGHKWLLGSPRPPHPMVLQSISWPARSAEASVTQFTVTAQGVPLYELLDYSA